jgi:hypothetical protein
MSDPLDQIRVVFEKAIGPYNKRQKIKDELKEPDVGKSKRARLVAEAAEVDAQWKAALDDLQKALNECPAFQTKN